VPTVSDHDHQVALQIDVRHPTLRKRTSRSEQGHR
jgi:hypothetical protein